MSGGENGGMEVAQGGPKTPKEEKQPNIMHVHPMVKPISTN